MLLPGLIGINWVLKSPTTAVFVIEREPLKLATQLTATTLSGTLESLLILAS